MKLKRKSDGTWTKAKGSEKDQAEEESEERVEDTPEEVVEPEQGIYRPEEQPSNEESIDPNRKIETFQTQSEQGVWQRFKKG